MIRQQKPLTQKQLSQMKITSELFKSEFKKVKTFFQEREGYKKHLRRAIKSYGIVNLPKSIQQTIPTDLRVLYEPPWYLNIVVWFRMLQIAWHNSKNECVRRAIDV